jgi:hypothetical protein
LGSDKALEKAANSGVIVARLKLAICGTWWRFMNQRDYSHRGGVAWAEIRKTREITAQSVDDQV